MTGETTDKMIAWGTMVTALGVVFAAWQVLLLKRQLNDAYRQAQNQYEQSRRQEALALIEDWNHSQPPNAYHCLELMANLEDNEFGEVLNRREVALRSNMQGEVLGCFSDQDGNELKNLFSKDNNTLTSKGTSVLVSRVMSALNSDDEVASAVFFGIGDKEMIYAEMRNDISMDDQKIIEKLRRVKGHEQAYPAIMTYLESQTTETKSKPPIGP